MHFDGVVLDRYQIYDFSLRPGDEPPILKIEDRGKLGSDLYCIIY